MNWTTLIPILVVALIWGIMCLSLRSERDQARYRVDVFADILNNVSSMFADEIDEHAKTEGHLKGMVTTGNHVFGLIINNLQTLDKSTLTRIRKFRNALDSAEKRI